MWNGFKGIDSDAHHHEPQDLWAGYVNDLSRLKFTATLPAGDTAGTVVEARRAVEKLGAVSVRDPLLPKGKWLHESEYHPLWQLASDLDFPIYCTANRGI